MSSIEQRIAKLENFLLTNEDTLSTYNMMAKHNGKKLGKVLSEYCELTSIAMSPSELLTEVIDDISISFDASFDVTKEVLAANWQKPCQISYMSKGSDNWIQVSFEGRVKRFSFKLFEY